MERNVFPDPAVAAVLSEKYIEARIHTDHETLGEANRALQLEMTQSRAQPIYLILDPATGTTHGRLDGAILGDNQPFIDFLEGGSESARE
jgi:hypothetical protein